MRHYPATMAFMALLASCATPQETVKIVTVEKLVPVPVMCSETVTKPLFKLSELSAGASLEAKIDAMIEDDRLHRAFELDLSAALVRCGGKITSQ